MILWPINRLWSQRVRRRVSGQGAGLHGALWDQRSLPGWKVGTDLPSRGPPAGDMSRGSWRSIGSAPQAARSHKHSSCFVSEIPWGFPWDCSWWAKQWCPHNSGTESRMTAPSASEVMARWYYFLHQGAHYMKLYNNKLIGYGFIKSWFLQDVAFVLGSCYSRSGSPTFT